MREQAFPRTASFSETSHYNYTDWGVGIANRDGTVVSYAFAWPTKRNGHATGAWQVQTGHYDIEDEGEDWFVTPDTLGKILADHGYPNLPQLYAEWKPMSNGVHEYLTEFIAAFQRDNRFEVPNGYPDRDSALSAIARFAVLNGLFAANLRDTLAMRMENEEGALRRDTASDLPEQTVRDWYLETYPEDTLGEDIEPGLTFADAAEAVPEGSAFYDVLGVGDSLVRERVFAEIAARESLTYGQVYGAWRDGHMLPERGAGAMIRAVIVPEGGLPFETHLYPDADGQSYLLALQEAVGGGIDAFDVLEGDFEGATLYVNAEGLFTCPPNRAVYATEEMARVGYLSQLDFATVVKPGDLYAVLHGDIVAVGFDAKTGRDKSLTDAQAKKVTDYFTKVSAPYSGMQAVAAIRRPELAPVPDERLDAVADALGFDLDSERRDMEDAKTAFLAEVKKQTPELSENLGKAINDILEKHLRGGGR